MSSAALIRVGGVEMTGADLLAYCPTCKIAFPIAKRREGGTFVVQNSSTKCPNGHFARVFNAHYQAFETEAQTTLENCGPAARKAALALWRRLSRRETTQEQAQTEAERIKPGLGSIFESANFSDPTRKAILDVLISSAAGSEPEEEPSITQPAPISDALPRPEATAPQEIRERRKGGNRAFQRSLRHKQRLLMNPRGR
jgi:hypothetical protein